jgi:serine/threonine-protein kinase
MLSSRVGDLIDGRYQLLAMLGEGGMGAVFEAEHIGVKRRYALKVLTASHISAEARERFSNEAMAAGRIGHPAIASVFDVGVTVHGAPYLAMELLAGQSLHDALSHGPLDVPQAVAITRQLLSALGAAHRVGIIHRDIKPANLWLCEDGTEQDPKLKVLDFGIAKNSSDANITSTGAVIGTPLYMAPEQALALSDLDARADIWSAGAVLFEMLTGRPVHVAPSVTAALVKTVTEPAPRVTELRPDVPEALADVVAKALHIERNERYASTDDMAAALGEMATPAMTVPPKAQVPARRLLLPLVGVAAGALVVVLLVRATSPATPVAAGVSSSGPFASVPSPVASLVAQPSAALAAAGQPSFATSVPAPTTPRALAPSSRSAARSAAPAALPPATPSVSPTVVPACPVGQVWQVDHCERPLATKAPF